MAIDKVKLARISSEDRQDVDFLRKKAADPLKNVNGSVSSSLAAVLRSIAVSDYVNEGSPSLFKAGVSEAAFLRLELFERFNSGDVISPSLVSMMSYKALLDSLAAGDYELAKSLASLMGGRDEIEREYDRPFDIAFGYALKNLVLPDFDAASQWVDSLEDECKSAENFDFSGYAKVLRAILNGGKVSADLALKEVLVGHERQCSGKGLFKDTEDELLCVWGIAIANLARVHGLQLESVDSFIPADLLI